MHLFAHYVLGLICRDVKTHYNCHSRSVIIVGNMEYLLDPVCLVLPDVLKEIDFVT